MDFAFIVAALSLILSLILTPLFRQLAHTLHIVDNPNSRKVHEKAIPYLGGLSFYFTFFIILATTMFLKPVLFSTTFITNFKPIFLCSTIIVLMGIADDTLGLKASIKLLIQGIIGYLMYQKGFKINMFTLPFAGVIDLQQWSVVFTMVWFAAIMNAINLSDGLDGLAGGICFFSAASMGAIFFVNGNLGLTIYCAILAGAILGFLKYNFHPASIFMGDTGSLLLGYLLATAALLEHQKAISFIALLVPVIATMIPIIDTSMAIMRRLANKQHPFRADRKHLHHRLLDIGLSHKQTVLFIYFLSFYFGLFAFVLNHVFTNSSGQLGANQAIPFVILLMLFLFGLYWMLIYLENTVLPMKLKMDRYMKRKTKKK